MFHNEILPLRSNAGRIAAVASSVLGALSDDELHAMLREVDSVLDAIAQKCERVRTPMTYTYSFTQTAWMPTKVDTEEFQTDLDFLLHEQVMADPRFGELLTSLSGGNPDYGLLRVISLLVLRDLRQGDLWSIQRIQSLFDQLIADESRLRSDAFRGRKRGAGNGNATRRAQFDEVVDYVMGKGQSLLDAGKSKAHSIAILTRGFYPVSTDG